jgi:tRNA-dihydrouridine synthase A
MNPRPPLWTPARLSVAPMMDWTDRHCRFFHRQLSRQALLYTEMITAQAIVFGPRDRLLAFDPAEQPVALQLGGAEPGLLARAVRLAAPFGYGEMNLNVGCPSDRVKSGCFGAVLMKDPALVADCVAAMIEASPVEVTVKCRIGVDDQEPRAVLPAFIERLAGAGVRRIAIHARKAWLQGLSPRENRDIPPLDYPLVLEMKRAFPALHISVNGGITALAQAKAFLAEGLDGVMIGRAAYHEPFDLLARADAEVFGTGEVPDPWQVVDQMRPYIAAHLAAGGRLHQITRHMLGLFHGRPGARQWRRILSEGANAAAAGEAVLDAALAATLTAQAA